MQRCRTSSLGCSSYGWAAGCGGAVRQLGLAVSGATCLAREDAEGELPCCHPWTRLHSRGQGTGASVQE